MKKNVGIVLAWGMFVLAGCSTYCSGLKVITGVVADVNGKPVQGALVTTNPPTSSVSTDKEGQYMIKAYREGEYTLRANKLGYVSTPTKIEIRGIDFVQGDIRLTPEELMPVSAPTNAETETGAEEAAPKSEGKSAGNGEKSEKKSEKKVWWDK